jgi:hypothetical protein
LNKLLQSAKETTTYINEVMVMSMLIPPGASLVANVVRSSTQIGNVSEKGSGFTQRW